MSCEQGLVGGPSVQQRRRYGRSRASVSLKDGQAQFRTACCRDERPDQSDRARDERRRDACSAKRERPSFAAEACDLRAGGKQPAPPDGMAKIGFVERPAGQIAGADRNDPRMRRDNRAAHGALIARRSDDEDAAPGGVIKRFENRSPFRRR